jgi:hypothetical protein
MLVEYMIPRHLIQTDGMALGIANLEDNAALGDITKTKNGRGYPARRVCLPQPRPR